MINSRRFKLWISNCQLTNVILIHTVILDLTKTSHINIMKVYKESHLHMFLNMKFSQKVLKNLQENTKQMKVVLTKEKKVESKKLILETMLLKIIWDISKVTMLIQLLIIKSWNKRRLVHQEIWKVNQFILLIQ